MKNRSLHTALITLVCLAILSPVHATGWTKKQGAFYPPVLMKALQQNLSRHDWAKVSRDQAVSQAQPWKELSDEDLWQLMYGPTISRSWMVWSDGFCPSCNQSVPMYNWKMDALKEPWKVRCPHCDEAFPKNDFKKFYDSGLDRRGVFDPAQGDRSLLFNCDHPDPYDPKHLFGVDDGEGFVRRDGDKDLRWRFIGAYLIYGQWKQAVRDGIIRLADAYTLTVDPVYAHKAAILLDRVADHYPDFDFKEQGILYEGPGSAGYITTWHDACEETREMALAYDQIFAGIAEDRALVEFLSNKSRECGLENPKDSVEAIRKNIEDRLLRDPLAHQDKIHSNYPRKEVCVAVIQTVLGWPENRAAVMEHLDSMIDQATAVDGVTGEKGLANYSAFVLQSLAEFLALYTRIDPSFLGDLMDRHPKLRATYRFHIDTWCGQKYYPLSGDTGWFAKDHPIYVGVLFRNQPTLIPSMYSFLDSLYEVTGDSAYLQVLYSANDHKLEELPYDLFVEDPESFQRKVKKVIDRVGPIIPLGSVDKKEWRLAILRSGSGEHERSAWIDYDSEGGHSHLDGMNLGLFAKGLDLLPDFGYPPVQFGGWASERSRWYRGTLAHNTVVVDGKDQKATSGKTEFFADGDIFHAIQVSGPEIYDVSTYQRTVFLIDIDEENSYILDRFQIEGGREHTRRFQSTFGYLHYKGLEIEPSDPWSETAQMKRYRTDANPKLGWMVDWTLEDRYGVLDASREVHLRLTDLTSNCEVAFAESWVNPGGYTTNEEEWIPTVLTRTTSKEEPLSSDFISVLEPYEGEAQILHARKISLMEDAWTRAIEVSFRDGRTDLFLFQGGPEEELLVARNVHLQAEVAWLRFDPEGRIRRVAWIRGTGGRLQNRELILDRETDFYEAAWSD